MTGNSWFGREVCDLYHLSNIPTTCGALLHKDDVQLQTDGLNAFFQLLFEPVNGT